MNNKTNVLVFEEETFFKQIEAIVRRVTQEQSKSKKETLHEQDLWKAKDVAREFRLSEATVYRYVKEGILPSFKLKGGRYFRRNEVLAIMNKRYDLQ